MGTKKPSRIDRIRARLDLAPKAQKGPAKAAPNEPPAPKTPIAAGKRPRLGVKW